jgi:hypothetical protein
MKKIFSSPSSLVFLVLAFALCVFTYRGTVDAKDFMMLTSMAFVHYFKRGDLPVDKTVDKPIANELG